MNAPAHSARPGITHEAHAALGGHRPSRWAATAWSLHCAQVRSHTVPRGKDENGAPHVLSARFCAPSCRRPIEALAAVKPRAVAAARAHTSERWAVSVASRIVWLIRAAVRTRWLQKRTSFVDRRPSCDVSMRHDVSTEHSCRCRGVRR